ncbi:hypothetical protein AYO49_06320 [Verrucomicrobiaceae bacterium SCGC AG-212-N21]|nr:hypothetical protein AYO49_06320 [Verrucomicrobiaceae bacterium SCGC AG-212-N21]
MPVRPHCPPEEGAGGSDEGAGGSDEGSLDSLLGSGVSLEVDEAWLVLDGQLVVGVGVSLEVDEEGGRRQQSVNRQPFGIVSCCTP